MSRKRAPKQTHTTTTNEPTVADFLSGKAQPSYDSLPPKVRIVARSFSYEFGWPKTITAVAGTGPVTYSHKVDGPVTQQQLQNIADNAALALDRTKEIAARAAEVPAAA